MTTRKRLLASALGSASAFAAQRSLVAERTAALLASEERFHSVFRLSAVGMALVAPDGRFLLVNPALCELTGRTTAELTGQSWREIVAPDEVAAALAWQGRALAGATEPLHMPQRLLRSFNIGRGGNHCAADRDQGILYG